MESMYLFYCAPGIQTVEEYGWFVTKNAGRFESV